MNDPRIFNVMAATSVTIKSYAYCDIKRGSTGRELKFSAREHEAEGTLVHDWFSCTSDDAFKAHAAWEQVKAAFRTAPKVTSRIAAYRGRRIPKSTEAPGCFDFGPPSQDRAGDGRYNRANVPVLYLSTKPYGVSAELQERRNPDEEIFYQDYSIDCDSLDVADFSSDELENIGHIAFDFCERLNDDAGYRKSQLLADLVLECGFSGMLVPGVRGTRENRYCNLVMFYPAEDWRAWVLHTSSPKRVIT